MAWSYSVCGEVDYTFVNRSELVEYKHQRLSPPFFCMSSLSQKDVYTFDRVFRLGISLLLIAGVIGVVHYLNDILLPFVIGFLGAYLLNPSVLFFQKWLSRVWAIVVVFLLIALAVVPIARMTGLMIGNQMIEMARIIQKIMSSSEVPYQIQRIVNEDMWQSIVSPLSQDIVLDTLHQQEVWSIVWQVLQKIAPGALGFFNGVFSIMGSVLSIGVIFLYLIFILVDFNTVQREIENLIPKAWRKNLLSFLQDINSAMSVYFRSRLFIALIQGVLFAIGLTVLKVPMGIVLGLSIGLMSMIPYAQLLGIIPAVLFGGLAAIDSGASLLVTTGVISALFIVIQFIDDAILTPRIMGSATGLSPAILLVSISIWGKLLGLLGLIIAIPITCVLLAWYKRVNT